MELQTKTIIKFTGELAHTKPNTLARVCSSLVLTHTRARGRSFLGKNRSSCGPRSLPFGYQQTIVHWYRAFHSVVRRRVGRTAVRRRFVYIQASALP